MNLLIPMLLILTLPAPPQKPEEPPRKPVLIRDDRTGQKVESEVDWPDPVKARKHVQVGDFYFKRHNYEAARSRYREAVKYNPKWPKAYDRLVKVLEKLGDLEEAARVCQQFVKVNPGAREARRFRQKAAKLKRKAGR